jgi:hypothetical protein
MHQTSFRDSLHSGFPTGKTTSCTPDIVSISEKTPACPQYHGLRTLCLLTTRPFLRGTTVPFVISAYNNRSLLLLRWQDITYLISGFLTKRFNDLKIMPNRNRYPPAKYCETTLNDCRKRQTGNKFPQVAFPPPLERWGLPLSRPAS